MEKQEVLQKTIELCELGTTSEKTDISRIGLVLVSPAKGEIKLNYYLNLLKGINTEIKKEDRPDHWQMMAADIVSAMVCKLVYDNIAGKDLSDEKTLAHILFDELVSNNIVRRPAADITDANQVEISLMNFIQYILKLSQWRPSELVCTTIMFNGKKYNFKLSDIYKCYGSEDVSASHPGIKEWLADANKCITEDRKLELRDVLREMLNGLVELDGHKKVEKKLILVNYKKPPEPEKPVEEELEWKCPYGLDHIPEDIFQKALDLVDKGLIDKIEVFKNDKGKEEVKINYYFVACTYDRFKKPIEKAKTTSYLTKLNNTPISVCGTGQCNELRCIPAVAGYIKYAREKGFWEKVLSDRKAYREAHGNKDENLFFDWNPKDMEKFKNVPPYMFDLAENMLEKNMVAIRPYMDEDNWFSIDFIKVGNCALKNEDKTVFGSLEAGPHDIKREVLRMEKPCQKLPNSWIFKPGSSIFENNIGKCKCDAPFCPYAVAAYILYLRLKGRENEIEEAKAYSKEHPEEVYWGHDNFAFNLSEETTESMKETISSVSDDVLAKAFEVLDSGEASLIPSKQVATQKGKEVSSFKLNLSRFFNQTDNIEECFKEYTNESNWYTFTGFLLYENIQPIYKLLRIIASIDYCRRKRIDISDALNKRNKDIAKLKNMSEVIEGLDRLYSFVKSDKTSSLSCIMQGSKGSGKTDVIKSVADLLSQNGKISTNLYNSMTLQQLSEELTKHKTDPGQYSELTKGYEFYHLDTKRLYVLTGLDEFLKWYKWYSEERGYRTTGTSLRHMVRELGRFAKNTYVIIISSSERTTEEFLELNKKFKYTFGQNIVVFNNKSEDELYAEYLNGLSEEVKSQITDEDEHHRKFVDFISLNERFLPFLNSELSHYLSEYSNVNGKPIFPPDVYDKKAVTDSLENMIGMDAVKKQLASFESYITFQKKAKATGVNVKQGNLHMQFLGNPGTGKTTIARIVAKMLYDIGILEENKVVEVERKDLIAEYTGQTAIKTSEKIQEAMGGVLFVDEAYALYLDENDTFGKEAIATIIKAMEDFKDRLIVIFAGYDKEMQDFLKANSGIESRIGYTFHFEDYTASELTEIFRRSITGQHFTVSPEVLQKVREICDYYRKRKNFGNGRFAKRIEQQVIINHANNMGNAGWEIKMITADEVPDVKNLGRQSSGGEEKTVSLDEIIGMDSVKDQIAKFKKKIQFEQSAKAAGIKIKPGNSHMLFLGNPGTGKTTIARIVVRELYETGVLEENKLVEVERKDLVGRYTGQTAIKTNEKIQEALGGILFVDEAYSLYMDEQDSFGKEAIATLIKAMEDYKDRLVVIFAGYDKEMLEFLKANSGIESRIGYSFHFEDYTAPELTEIFRRSITGQNFIVTEDALKKVSDVCEYYRKRKNFGNGRFAKRIEQAAIINHANNMGNDGWDIKVISADDIPDIRDLGKQTSGGEDVIPIENVIGMTNVKNQLNKFKKRIQFEQKAKQMGAKIKRGNSHMLFLGNPGTGKTTIARIIAKELYEAGVILENKLLEVERKDLIGQYLGQTAPKTAEVIERAMGGVLFIDEAYSLAVKHVSGTDYGGEAIATLIKAMEDHKDEFVVIFAGYEKEMGEFLELNSGIASRIGYTFNFEDYTAEELTEIFKLKMRGNGLTCTEEALANVKTLMQYFVSVPNFGNGRFAERVVNVVVELHADRLAEHGGDLLTVTPEDIPTVKHMLDIMPDGKNMINPESIKEAQHNRTAIHELGHALLVKLLTPDNGIERITIAAEGNGALGYVRHKSGGVGNMTKSELNAMICVKMAGLAAEEVFLGEYGNGGTSDIESATNIATNMVLRFGMSKHGFAAFRELDEDGKKEINEILKEQFDVAKQRVEEYKVPLSKAKEYLLKNHTITDAEFTDIVIGHK